MDVSYAWPNLLFVY